MANYSTYTGYPGGSSTVANANATPVAAYDFNALQTALKERLRRKNEEYKGPAPREIYQDPRMQYQASPQYQAQAIERPMRQNDPGIPNYVKMITSPGVVPGYARASAGDPGAVFAGYIPRDAMIPSSATFTRNPSPPGEEHEKGPDIYSDAYRRKAAYSAYR